MSSFIGLVVSKRMATLHELQTVYGQKDLHNMIEIITVDSFNAYQANKRAQMDNK